MILIESTMTRINTREITRGTLIWMKHSAWADGKSGIVVNATPEAITVLILQKPQNAHCHIIMNVSDLEAGKWQVRYSTDGMLTVTTYGFDPEESEE